MDSPGGDKSNSGGGYKTPPSVRKHFEHLQPLSIRKVRWFYQEEKKWLPFNGSDSMKIEHVFRSLPEDDNFDKSSVRVPIVRGSLYAVDVIKRECTSIFWRENNVSILRGTWFKGSHTGSWEPLDEKTANKIEEANSEVVTSLGTGSSKMSFNETVIHRIKIGVNRLEWHDLSQVYMVSETTGSKIAQKIGFSGTTELHRGYNKDCDEMDRPADITHIVFLVHGMGQLYSGDSGIVYSRKKLIEAISRTNSRFFKENQPSVERIEFFPIEWRSQLKLDEGMIESITPTNIGSLRKVINHTTLDVFYYTSPLYREEIVSQMRKQLNSVYEQYTCKNPSFERNGGKVSVIAHSLGSVIIHDVLTFWNSYLIEEDKKNADNQVADVVERSYSWFWGWRREHVDQSESPSSDLVDQLHEARMKVAKLENEVAAHASKHADECYSLLFKVENVFNIGSPLGVFLVMRGIRPRQDIEQHILPTSVCKRTFNIYDPADPVAYRLEPLIYDYYSSVPPVRVAHFYAEAEPSLPSPSKTRGWLKGIFGGGASNESMDIEYTGSHVVLSRSENEKVETTLSGKKVLLHRIDYMLEQSMVEYFSAITSHQAYWHNIDFAKFLLHVLYESEESTNQTRI